MSDLRLPYYLERICIFFGLRPRHRNLLQQAHHLYGCIVQAARNPLFYSDCAVRDDKDGRFEMLSLHLFLILERLRQEPALEAEDDIAILGDLLSEVAVSDLEANLREMGVGDLAVGRRVQKMTKRHYARMNMYHDLFVKDNSDERQSLDELIEYVLSDEKGVAPLKSADGGALLVQYIQQNGRYLAEQSIGSIIKEPQFMTIGQMR